jgi:hypothetical protein
MSRCVCESSSRSGKQQRNLNRNQRGQKKFQVWRTRLMSSFFYVRKMNHKRLSMYLASSKVSVCTGHCNTLLSFKRRTANYVLEVPQNLHQKRLPNGTAVDFPDVQVKMWSFMIPYC